MPQAGKGSSGYDKRKSTSALTADEDLLTVNEVASALRVSRMTIYRLLEQGELDYIRIGKGFRILKVALNRYLNASH